MGGEQGVVELTALIGYFAAVSWLMNVARTPAPAVPPGGPLQRFPAESGRPGDTAVPKAGKISPANGSGPDRPQFETGVRPWPMEQARLRPAPGFPPAPAARP